MSHDHSHSGSKNIKLAFFLNLGFTIFEIIGGFLTNSVAILSDALHDLGDSLSLGISWYLQKKSAKAANPHFTFGYKRFSLLGALINSIILIGGSIYIILEALERIQHPEVSHAPGMLFFAIVGISVNGFAAWKLKSGKSLNEKVLSWHLLEDVLGWAAVLVVAIILMFWQIDYLDPALSLLITLFILFNVFKRLKETMVVFLQGKPTNINLEDLLSKLQNVSHVNSFHHTHLWSLDGEHHVFTTHLVLDEINSFDEITEVKQRIADILKDYPISHHTIEIELNTETCSLAEKR